MSCAVISCNNYKSRRLPGISFHRFPKDRYMVEKWVQALGLPDTWIWSENKYVCSNHFHEEDFFNYRFQNQCRKTLKNTAVPSLLIYKRTKEVLETAPDIHENYAELELPEIDDEGIIEERTVSEPEPILNLKRPNGEKYLRVCRICMTIQKKEDTTPLIIRGSVGMTELYTKLRDFLQIELYPVDDSCVCKRCENFINETYSFISSCKKNEEALSKFDWSNKTRNLLHIVDQKQVARFLDEIPDIVVKEEQIDEPDENYKKFEEVDLKKEPYFDEFPNVKIEDEGNGLSDMEDHWYYKDDMVKESYEFPRKLAENSWNHSFQIPTEDDLFSPAFDKYFNTFKSNASVRLITRCLKYHVAQYGDPPYLCEICGELIYSKPCLTKHMNNHAVARDDEHLVFFECPLCQKKFTYQKSLTHHLETHRRDTNFHKFDNIKRFKTKMIGGLRKLFNCNTCGRKYPKIGSLVLHRKMCHKEENSEEKTCTDEENDQELVLENYDFFMDDHGNAQIVILEENANFFNEFQNGTIGLE